MYSPMQLVVCVSDEPEQKCGVEQNRTKKKKLARRKKNEKWKSKQECNTNRHANKHLAICLLTNLKGLCGSFCTSRAFDLVARGSFRHNGNTKQPKTTSNQENHDTYCN